MATSTLRSVLRYTTICILLVLFFLVSTLKTIPQPSQTDTTLDTNSNATNDAKTRLQARWYSVLDYAIANSDPNQPFRGPWPPCPKSGSDRPGQVVVCFADKVTYTQLYPFFQGALAKWAPAMRPYTGLEIVPDPACNGDWKCYCDDNVRPDTLRITFGPKTRATLGYGYHHYWRNTPGQNSLEWNIAEQAPIGHSDPQGYDTQIFAHELGHVIGLAHEHQRPGAANDLFLDVKAFLDYEQMLIAIMADERANRDPAFNGVNNADARLQMLTKDYSLARTYWPGLAPYVPRTSSTGRAPDEVYRAEGGPIDTLSMTMYSTLGPGTKYEPARNFYWVALSKKIPDASQPHGFRQESVWQGGYENPRNARPSAGDIARVLALYPLPPGGWPPPPANPPQPGLPQPPHPRRSKRETKQRKLKVVIGDLTTTISPMPSQTPIIPGSKEWQDAVKNRLGADGKFMGNPDDEVWG